MALIDNHIENNVHIGLINIHIRNRGTMDGIKHVDGYADMYCELLAENEKISDALAVYGVNTKRSDDDESTNTN